MSLDEICVGLMIFRAPGRLTNCASHDTLAKRTRPGGIYKHLQDLMTQDPEAFIILL